jgi:ribonuclease P/MRP protein subunit RPP40
VISKDQYGFMPGLSTKTNLLTFWNKVTAGLESNESCDVVYFDFAKAFDKVPHGPLIHKLEINGITGRLLIWIKNWLTDRTRVVLNGSSSEYCNVTSSVPQWSVLGPTLFLIYINDLCNEVTCESFLFADDTKIFQPVNNESDGQKLQQNIDNMYRWRIASEH